ncbi:hypothetical protein H072_8739 [Dactylellina haptotyla CBS 200.50]|uniref:Zn(2)-C6 fungal-type domain-containing protein n=1 Tax=Dactylellina haptotyla (strain CBS 200.50) TaxID=1284197 RepID=S8A8W7_DACHA|nr:hypothetical protein H072_8739 [Dactylellina haptotyla CBS 200.50]
MTKTDDHKDDASESGGEQQGPITARNPACDLCREKKVRCGREKPICRNCKTWKAACTYSERQKRENESTRIAHRFEEVHDRLDRLESTMQRIAVALELSNMTAHHNQQQQSQVQQLPPQQSSPFASQMMHSPMTTMHPTPPGFPSLLSPSPSRDSGGATTPSRVPPSFLNTNGPTASAAGSRHGGSHQPGPSGSPTGSAPPRTLVKDPKGNVHYLGASSILSISSEAESLAEARLSAAAAAQVGPGLIPSSAAAGVVEAMGALRTLKGLDSNIASLLPYDGYMELKMGGRDYIAPSRDEAIRLIDNFFDKINKFFPLFRYDSFMKNVNKMYEKPSAMSDRGWLVCFNNVLLFSLYGMGTNKKEDIQIALVEKYFYNSWAAFDDVSILLTPNLINVQALLTLAIVAQEISKPGLCWMLLSQACRLAQAIGLHRQSHPAQNFSEEESVERQLVFWTLYVMDKALSLTFGRSTCLPDFDVDVDLPDNVTGNVLLTQHFSGWVWLAKIQSQIYMRLYSASACRASDEDRQHAAKELELELRNWWAQNGAGLQLIPSIGLFEKQYLELEIKFSFHNSMIMIHRVNKGGGELSEAICLDSARTSVQLIKQTLEVNNEAADGSVLLWLFQYFPFTPFFVLFSNVIRNPEEKSSRDDFVLMQHVVSYLDRMKAANESASKLLRIAETFTQIAAVLLRKFEKPSHSESRKRKHAAITGVSEGNKSDDGKRPNPNSRPGSMGSINLEAEIPTNSATTRTASEVPTMFPHAFNFLRWPNVGAPNSSAVRPGSSHDNKSSSSSGSNPPLGTSAADPSTSSSSSLPFDAGIAAMFEGATAGFDFDLEALMAEPVDFQSQMQQAHRQGPLDFDWFQWDQYTQGLSESPGMSFATLAGMKQ